MGMHRWLIGPLICLILATTSARPPECQEPPSWSINGQQPLAETKGKASMLEALLKHFRSYGMEDLEFIIVNSKLSHARDKLDELKKRVSFEVYQETDEEEVWSIMEGGKDDMYVYDRCGRLTYYIPFPLTILNESPLVSNAILATYFRSPCGVNCDQNKTVEIDDFVKNIDDDYDTANVTEQDNSTLTDTDQPLYTNEPTTDLDQHSNDVLYITTPLYNDTDSFNLNNTDNITDYNYTTFDEGLKVNETNTTNVEQAKSFFDSIYRLFFSENSDDKLTENVLVNQTLNETSFDENNLKSASFNDTSISRAHTHHMEHGHHGHHNHHHESKINDTQHQKKSDRCQEADYEVCEGWSKKRLLHAQKCCSETTKNSEDRRSCYNFGKKRCKKLQPILKCCIKTVYTEHGTTVPTIQSPIGENAEMDLSITQVITEQTTSTVISDTVCCKTVSDAKLCRVSYAGACEENEYIESSQSHSK